MEGSIVQEVRKDNVNPFGNQQNSTAMDVRSVCDPAKMFFTSKFSCVLFCNPTPPIKLKLGQQICGRLLIANHLDQSL
jgi:hypothetical protein